MAQLLIDNLANMLIFVNPLANQRAAVEIT